MILKNFVICPICNKKLGRITHKHLKNHNITFKEFKKKYSDFKLNSDYHLFRITQSNKGKKLSKEHILKLSKAKKGKIPKTAFKKGHKLSNKSIQKMLETKKKNNTFKCKDEIKRKLSLILTGRKKSKEHLKKIGLGNKGKKLSEETKRKISLANKGKKLSEETKEKIRIINIGKKHSKQTLQKLKDKRLKQKNTWESSIEKKIQSFLTELKVPFIKHKVIGDIEHRYQCDIYMPDLNMIIECDGDYWHNYPNGNGTDKIRNKELKEKKYKLLRLWERDIKNMNITQFRSILCNSYYNQI